MVVNAFTVGAHSARNDYHLRVGLASISLRCIAWRGLIATYHNFDIIFYKL